MIKEGSAGSHDPVGRRGSGGLVPVTRATRDGQPLSLNRAPAPDIAPWIARIMAIEVDAPTDSVVRGTMFNDSANVRLLLSGRWSADCADGHHRFNQHGERQALFFGAHSRAMPITVAGPFRVIGVSFRPGAEHVMSGPLPATTMDRIVDYDEVVGHGRLGDRIDAGASGEAWALELEQIVREMIARRALSEPDPVTRAFDAHAFAAPEAPVAAFARSFGIEQKRLERIVKRDFGMTPKQVLRRARALDMASQLLGVAAPDEADELALRYFDQSHQIRELSHFLGMTPQQLAVGSHPLLRITLEGRQARRLEELHRIDPDGVRPWE